MDNQTKRFKNGTKPFVASGGAQRLITALESAVNCIVGFVGTMFWHRMQGTHKDASLVLLHSFWCFLKNTNVIEVQQYFGGALY